MELIRIKDKDSLKVLSEKLSDHFTETWDYTIQELLEDNIFVLSTKDLSYCSILRVEKDYIHYDFSLLDSPLRNKGIGTKMIKQIIEYFKKYSLNIRATVRLNNYASYKSLLKNEFIQGESFIVGSDLGVEMIYFNRTINVEKYISSKKSSCGLTVLSAFHDLKFKEYIAPDKIEIPCIENKGIPKELMRQYLITKYKDVKQVSNFNISSEQCFHLIENHLTKLNAFVICDIGTDLIYEHWVLIYKYDSCMFYIIDSEQQLQKIPKLKFYDSMIQTNMFSFLL